MNLLLLSQFCHQSSDTEELALGAEAKHYGHFSPRLSPLISFEKDEKEVEETW
jgi:hypothetical protein